MGLLERAIKVIRSEGIKSFLGKTVKWLMYRSSLSRNLNWLIYRSDLLLRDLWVREFHRTWFYSNVWKNDIRWLGVTIVQNPMDMWILQEILYETRPDFVIEAGTHEGGSALFFATILDIVQHGNVITIDVQDHAKIDHPRVTRIIGDSTSEETIDRVRRMVNGKDCMVFLDTYHNKEHVLRETELYHQFVKKGHYLVVADTHLNGHPVLRGHREIIDGRVYHGGPMEAVMEFLKSHDEFIIDKSREKLLFTQFPSGFLLRVR